MSTYRIGHGIDIHPLVAGRACILGGATIPSDVGPDGHSDADVILHALMDALLGAIGESDIGTHFPNTDPKYKGAASTQLLAEVWKLVRAKGFELANCDIAVVTETPKLKPYISEMKGVISKLLDSTEIGIKATTAEKLGAIGRGEGIYASATVLLVRE